MSLHGTEMTVVCDLSKSNFNKTPYFWHLDTKIMEIKNRTRMMKGMECLAKEEETWELLNVSRVPKQQ